MNSPSHHCMPSPALWIAFAGARRIAEGTPAEVAAKVKAQADSHPRQNVLIFDASTSHSVELDLRGSVAAVLKRVPKQEPCAPLTEAPAATATARPPGRPRLGVVAREVTLLPRHWEWLAAQPGGASVALRKLVEQARRTGQAAERVRLAQESAYRFMTAMAGDHAGYEEATRALFAGDREKMSQCMAGWPRDVREHVLALTGSAEMSDQIG